MLARPGGRLTLTLLGLAATILGLIINNLTPRTDPSPFGLPTAALLAYLAGAALLRLLQATPTDPRRST
jgi:hypothetical protein